MVNGANETALEHSQSVQVLSKVAASSLGLQSTQNHGPFQDHPPVPFVRPDIPLGKGYKTLSRGTVGSFHFRIEAIVFWYMLEVQESHASKKFRKSQVVKCWVLGPSGPQTGGPRRLHSAQLWPMWGFCISRVVPGQTPMYFY